MAEAAINLVLFGEDVTIDVEVNAEEEEVVLFFELDLESDEFSSYTVGLSYEDFDTLVAFVRQQRTAASVRRYRDTDNEVDEVDLLNPF